MLWLLAAVDLTAGLYLIVWALRREERDRPGVFAVGVMLLVCAIVIAGLGVFRAQDETSVVPPVAPVGPLAAKAAKGP